MLNSSSKATDAKLVRSAKNLQNTKSVASHTHTHHAPRFNFPRLNGKPDFQAVPKACRPDYTNSFHWGEKKTGRVRRG